LFGSGTNFSDAPPQTSQAAAKYLKRQCSNAKEFSMHNLQLGPIRHNVLICDFFGVGSFGVDDFENVT
jgi:hypothetical protein